MIDIESLLRREAEDLLPEIEDSIREGDFEMAEVNQRCHVTGIGFGTILQVKEIEQEGLRTKVTTKLRICFDAGITRWKSLNEVELIEEVDEEERMERRRQYWEDRRAIERDYPILY